MPDRLLDFDTFYDQIHVGGLTHLALLAETVTALRASMADAETADDQFAFVYHILSISRVMLSWTRYLVPKDDGPGGQSCAECEGEEEEE